MIRFNQVTPHPSFEYDDPYAIIKTEGKLLLDTPSTQAMLNSYAHRLAYDWGRIAPFQYSIDVEGVKNFVFGARAGPTSNAFNLAHEMAHVIQLSPKELETKMINGSLRFDAPSVWVFNRYCCEPTTDKMSRRELETFVIQWFILGQPNLQDYLEVIDGLFSFLPDSYHFHSGAFQNTPSFKLFLDKEFVILLEKWNLDKVQSSWIELSSRFNGQFNRMNAHLGAYCVQ